MPSKKISVFILLSFLLAVESHFKFLIKTILAGNPYGPDFVYYLNSASLYLKGAPYSSILNFHSLGYYILFIPFTVFSSRDASIAWLVMGYALLFVSIWLILKIYRDKPSAQDWLILMFLVFSFKPINDQVYWNQSNFLLLFLLSASLFLLKNRKMVWAGILLGLCISVREYFAVLILLFLWRREWRYLLGVMLGLIFLKAAGIIVFHWTNEVLYWQGITTFISSTSIMFSNFSLSAAIHRLGNDSNGESLVCFVISLLVRVFFIVWALYLTKKRHAVLKDSIVLEFCLFLILAFLITPWVTESHFVALFPAILIAWMHLEKKENILNYCFFVLAYVLLGLGNTLGFPAFALGPVSIFNTGIIWGLIILFILTGRMLGPDSAAESKTNK